MFFLENKDSLNNVEIRMGETLLVLYLGHNQEVSLPKYLLTALYRLIIMVCSNNLPGGSH